VFLKFFFIYPRVESPIILSSSVKATIVGIALPDESDRTISIPFCFTAASTDFDDPRSIPTN